MSFLAPLFLAGALAVAAAVLFHLIRRTTRERRPFGSLMFLLPSPPRLTRRSKLENILLLLLRCTVLCLLALGFARPFLNKPMAENSVSAPKRTLVLVDTSASMRRANLWADARDKAKPVFQKASPQDEVAVYTFDREVKPLLTFEQWKSTPPDQRAAVASGKLAEAAPGWSGTYMASALIRSAEELADTKAKPAAERGEIVLITDLQEGSHLESLQGYVWPKGIKLSVETLKPSHISNAALQLAPELDEGTSKTTSGVRVKVSNASDSRSEQFKVGWANNGGESFVEQPAEVYVPPGQSRILTISLPSNGAIPERLTLKGDEEDFDNTIFAVPPQKTLSTVLYFGDDSETNSRQPLYFLERAFQDTRQQAVRVAVRVSGAKVALPEAHAAGLFIIADPLSDQSVDLLREQIVGGKTALVLIKSQSLGQTLGKLLGVENVPVEEGHSDGYAMLADIDFQHPLFAPFADPRFSDFTKIHFWRYRRLDAAAIPGARVLAKFDNGSPALLETAVGKGRILVLTSGWQPDDSQLALSSKFVPLLYSLLEASGSPAGLLPQYRVGDVVPLAGFDPDAPLRTIRSPSGSETRLNGETNFSATLVPGIYTVSSAQSTQHFAVNLDPFESRTAPLSVDELAKLGAPILEPALSVAGEANRKVRLLNAELENRQKLWRWFLAGTMVLLLIETWLAGRTWRKSIAQTDQPKARQKEVYAA
jgi:hypothetical protein